MTWRSYRLSAELNAAAQAPLPPPTAWVSEEEYLRTSYRPDRELIDGELLEKPVPARIHSLVQAMIIHWFAMHMKEWSIAPESEVRTRVRAANYRLPDVALTPFATTFTKTQNEPPIAVIEIVSDDDRPADLRKRAADLRAMGVRDIWLIDPEARTAGVWTAEGEWEPATELRVAGKPTHLDHPLLWKLVDGRLESR